ncbi:MAG TPA: glycine cleavage system protein H [Acidimicrobiia bacterium]|nr:glycine cleavage system protein H [Acidimicrobiia bacterium]
MPVVKNCVLPDELYYDVERDVWARLDDDGEVTLGLTDVGQTRAGRILAVSFRRPVGAVIDRGRVLALLESGKWVGPVRSLFSGEITAVNEELLVHPTLVNEAFYTDGWIVRLRPSDPDERALWSTGPDAVRQYTDRIARPYWSTRGVDDDFWCVHCREGK